MPFITDTIYIIVAINPTTGVHDFEECHEDNIFGAAVVPAAPNMYFTCLPIPTSIH